MKKLLALTLLLVASYGSLAYGQKRVKFAIIADLHQDGIYDAPQRLTTFLDAAKKSKVDFIIDLGDFAMVKPENTDFIKLWNSYEGASYHVLGNHDMDNASKEEYMEFTGMSARYYSFVKGDYKFIVLDGNNLYGDGEYEPYDSGNRYSSTKSGVWIDPEQMEWLKSEVSGSDKRIVVFAHHSLENLINNREEVREIFESANQQAGYQKVVAVFSGHAHTNYQKEIGGIPYIQINSASYLWLGDKYKYSGRFSKETEEKYPGLLITAPYKDPLYAIVTLTPRKLQIKGTQSEFIAPSPWEVGVVESELPLPAEPKIDDFVFRFE